MANYYRYLQGARYAFPTFPKDWKWIHSNPSAGLDFEMGGRKGEKRRLQDWTIAELEQALRAKRERIEEKPREEEPKEEEKE